MLRRVLLAGILGLTLLSLSGVQAQQGIDIFMSPGDERLILVPGGETAMLINISTVDQQPYWFTLYGEETTSLSTRLLNLEGQEIPIERDEAGNVISLTVTQPVAGEYALELTAAQAGYWRVLYSFTEPTLPLPGEAITFTREARRVVFEEMFETNERGWWTGDVDDTLTVVSDGALQINLGTGQTLSGFQTLPGTQSSNYYASAEVTVSDMTTHASFGLVVRLVDGANFYLLQVTTGHWRFIALHEAVWQPVLDWQYDERLLDLNGRHSLTVWVMGDTYIGLWDGQPLGHVRDTTHISGGMGLFAEQPASDAPIVTLAWDNLQISTEPAGDYWAIPALPAVGTVQASLANTTLELTGLASQLVGAWYWNDAMDLRSMVLRLNVDGSFEQELAALTEGEATTTLTGQWRVDDERVLILTFADGSSERYTAQLDATGDALTLPEMDNRLFVRMVSD